MNSVKKVIILNKDTDITNEILNDINNGSLDELVINYDLFFYSHRLHDMQFLDLKHNELIDSNSPLAYYKNYKVEFKITFGDNVTSIEGLFAKSNLLIAPELNLKNIKRMKGAFYSCLFLTKVPAYNIQSVIDISEIFYGCIALNNFSVLSDTPNLRYADSSFFYCHTLKEIPNINFSNMKVMNKIFAFCNSLNIKFIDFPKNCSYALMFFRQINNNSNDKKFIDEYIEQTNVIKKLYGNDFQGLGYEQKYPELFSADLLPSEIDRLIFEREKKVLKIFKDYSDSYSFPLNPYGHIITYLDIAGNVQFFPDRDRNFGIEHFSYDEYGGVSMPLFQIEYRPYFEGQKKYFDNDYDELTDLKYILLYLHDTTSYFRQLKNSTIDDIKLILVYVATFYKFNIEQKIKLLMNFMFFKDSGITIGNHYLFEYRSKLLNTRFQIYLDKSSGDIKQMRRCDKKFDCRVGIDDFGLYIFFACIYCDLNCINFTDFSTMHIKIDQIPKLIKKYQSKNIDFLIPMNAARKDKIKIVRQLSSMFDYE